MDIVEELNAGEPATGEATPAAEPQAEQPQAEPQATPEAAAETPAEKAARERDEKGRFKAKAEEPIMVPIAALHETRDKVRDLEQRLAAIQPQQQAPQGPAVPDIFEDPEGFVQYQNLQLQHATLNTTLNISEEMTRQSAGSEVVDEAQQWGQQAFAQNPALYQHFLQQRNPYGFLVEQYKRASAFAKLGDDPSQIEEFLTWKQGQAAPQAQPQTPAVPSSLAQEQSSRGGAVPYQPPSLEEILRGKPQGK